MNNIDKTIEFLERCFDQSEYFKQEPDSKKYRLEHTYRVANIGMEIAVKERLNIEALVVGCLLHDISYIETFQAKEDWMNHGRKAAEIAKPFVDTLDFDEKTKNEILYGIAIHVDDLADFSGEKNAFTQSIGDADNIDRFDAFRFYEMLKYNQLELLSYKEQVKFIEEQIEKCNKLLQHNFATPTATALFHGRIQSNLEFLCRLQNQLNHSKSILDWEEKI